MNLQAANSVESQIIPILLWTDVWKYNLRYVVVAETP